jgi:hypothetical protein
MGTQCFGNGKGLMMKTGLISFVATVAIWWGILDSSALSAFQAEREAPSMRAPSPAPNNRDDPTETASETRARLLFGRRTAQRTPGSPTETAIANQPVITKVEAYAGRPYGLGKISFRLRAGDEMVDRTASVLLSDRENRTLYPVITKSAFQQFLQNVFGERPVSNPEEMHQLWFLFKGDQPLDVSLTGTGFVNVRVPVQVARPKQFDRFVEQWWKGYNEATQKQIETSDYPPIVETYLTSMIGKRLGLKIPDRNIGNKDPLFQTFELLFNSESIRLDNIEQSMQSGVDTSAAMLPLPRPIAWSPLVVSNLPAEIAVESIASYVPEECFYLRFGTWSNQIWLKKLMEEHGGDLGRMFQMRGFKYKIQSKFLKQLAIESTEFDQLFGGNLIADVALIGKDTFFNDGASVGVLLYSKNTAALENNLRNKRKNFTTANAADQVKLEEIEIDGTRVQLLSTTDNLYRSFYVVKGNCHLITTSQTMVKRFVEASQGIRSLGNSEEFQFARYQVPLERDDTVFVYMSSRFMQDLLLPQYQVELRRRNRIVTDMMLLDLATLAAQNEQAPAGDLRTLTDQGFLPVNFGIRPDRGNLQLVDGNWIDSIRGRRGYFVPIADMEVKGLTPEEARWYQTRAEFFTTSIKSLDPMLLALKRFDYQNRVERIVFDGKILPFGAEKFGWIFDKVGPPTKREVITHPNEIIRLQMSLKGGEITSEVPAHLLFAAVQDEFETQVNLQPSSFLQYFDTLRTTPGYIGSWPNAGYLDWIPGVGRTPDSEGFSYSRLLKLWRLQWNDFSIFAFDKQRLADLKPHLQVIESARPVQIRLKVGDLANSKLRDWANRINFERSWQTSIANVRFLNQLIQQFRIRPEHALDTAEHLLDVNLVCSLGGEYQLAELPAGRTAWISENWPSFSQPVLPEQHTAPVLKWFRGLELEVSQSETQFTIHGFLDVERQETASILPSFDLFKGFGNLFSSGDK